MVIDVTNRHRLLKTLLDDAAASDIRVQSASVLAASDDVDVLDAFIALAKNARNPAALQEVVGRGLASICFRRERDLEEIIFALMTALSAEAYDTEMGRLQRAHPAVRIARGIVGSGR